MDLIVNRYKARVTLSLAIRVMASTILIASVISVLAVKLYEVQTFLAAALFLMILGSSVNRIGSTFYRAHQRFGMSLTLIQIHNYVLLISVPVAVWLDSISVTFFITTAAIAYVVTALFGWIGASAQFAGKGVKVSAFTYFWESLAGMGITAAPIILMQTERFLIPQLLTYEQLANFGVLAAVVGAPFRMLQIGMGYTLLPRLRAADSRKAASGILNNEVRIALLLSLCITVVVLLGGPFIFTYFLEAKYDIGWPLLLTTVLIGYIKIWQSIVVAAVSALALPNELNTLNLSGWCALAIAVIGAWGLSGLGLLGIICGVGLAWVWQCLVGSVMLRIIFSRNWCS